MVKQAAPNAASWEFSPVSRLGHTVRDAVAHYLGRAAYVGAMLRAWFGYPPAARQLSRRTLITQIRFTAVHALPVLGGIAVVMGGTVIVQAYIQAVKFGVSDTLGKLIGTVIFRELGPLLTAITIIVRSGTAISAELASNSVLGEGEALEALGIDLLQLYSLPRIVGLALSAVVLTIYFDALSLLSALAVADALGKVSPDDFLASLRLTIGPRDVYLTLAKAALIGAGIGVLCTFEGLFTARRATDLPQAVTRGVVASLIFVVVVSTVISLLVSR